MTSKSAEQVRDFIPAGLLSAGRNVRSCATLSLPHNRGGVPSVSKQEEMR